jgi:arylsulfatase
LANFIGGDIPQDRTLDGVNQSDFLMGKAKKSARESMVIYLTSELFGAKWRNWKILLKELDDDYAIKNIAYPAVYNLIIDPKEEEPEKFYLDDTWVETPLWQVIGEHQASMEKDPGAPDSD